MGSIRDIKTQLPNDYSPTAIQNIFRDTHEQMDSIKTPGEITVHAGDVPAGYLVCNGQAVGRLQYSALFSAIGIKYGAGDQVNTFNVPNISAPATGTNYIVKY